MALNIEFPGKIELLEQTVIDGDKRISRIALYVTERSNYVIRRYSHDGSWETSLFSNHERAVAEYRDQVDSVEFFKDLNTPLEFGR